MVWLGKKVFEMRQKLSVKRKLIPEDEEKPFLEHLEDLRKTLTRIIATLLIGMVVCFVFKDQIFKLIERPILAADIGVLEKEQSPLGLNDPKEWPQVVSIAYGLLGLSEAQRSAYLSHAFTPETQHLQPVVDALLIHHAVQNLPPSNRESYLQAATAGNELLLNLVRDMERKKVDASFERGPKQMSLRFFKVGEGFNLSMKLSLYAGIVVAFPLLLYFLLEFIVPGLRPEERKVLWPALAVGFGLFIVGVLFAYLVVTPNALRFLYNYDLQLGGTTEYRFTDYANFVVHFALIFGLAFELPVIVYALNKLGILSYELMKNTRGYAVIIITVVAALITPTPDILNLALLAVPMIGLYEMSIWIAFFHDKRAKKREAAEEAAERAARLARQERAAMAGAYLDDPAHHTTDSAHSDHPPFSPDHESTDYHGHHAHDHLDYQPYGHIPQAPESPEQGTTETALANPPDAETTDLNHPPANETNSLPDRAEPWPRPPDPEYELDAQAPEAQAPEAQAPEVPATTSAHHTPGEPSEESRRHHD